MGLLGIALALLAAACGRVGFEREVAPDAAITITDAPDGAAARVALGRWHSCGVRSTGDVACWGENASAQLGDGTAPMDQALPRSMDSGAVGVAAGEFHSCAIDAAGAVTCWGANAQGQLGDGTRRDRPVPIAISSGSGGTAIELVAGNLHTCARAGAAVTCWGSRFAAGATDDVLVPTPVPDLGDAVELSAGSEFSCVRRATGAVACWGSNFFGTLGRPGADSATPVEVLGIADAVGLDAGNNHACALRATGRVACWGRNRNGNLGVADLADQPAPVEVPGVAGALQVCAGDFYTCARLATEVVCWGLSSGGRLGNPGADPDGDLVQVEPVTVLGLPPIGRLVCGGNHVCGETLAGDAVHCWGHGDSGQLGDGTTTNRSAPAPVSGFP